MPRVYATEERYAPPAMLRYGECRLLFRRVFRLRLRAMLISSRLYDYAYFTVTNADAAACRAFADIVALLMLFRLHTMFYMPTPFAILMRYAIAATFLLRDADTCHIFDTLARPRVRVTNAVTIDFRHDAAFYFNK